MKINGGSTLSQCRRAGVFAGLSRSLLVDEKIMKQVTLRRLEMEEEVKRGREAGGTRCVQS